VGDWFSSEFGVARLELRLVPNERFADIAHKSSESRHGRLTTCVEGRMRLVEVTCGCVRHASYAV